MLRVLIAASGTGGHIFPALAVAKALPDNFEVFWLGVSDRLEAEILPSNYKLKTIWGGGVQGSLSQRFLAFFQLFLSTFLVFSFIKKQKINIIFSTGGYIAGPTILAAFLSNVPIVLHESNAQPGRVVRLLGRFCKTVALGFPDAAQKIKGSNTLFTGTPVRPQFLISHRLPNWVPKGEGPLIVIMGGSQGALGLNRMVRFVAPRLLKVGCRIVHLTGKQDPDYQKFVHPNLVEKKFSDEIPALLQNADLAVSRSGASALSELAVCETPAILVPYPQAKDKHQEINAMNFVRSGAAVIVHQHDEKKEALWDALARLLNIQNLELCYSKDLLSIMRSSMRRIAVYDADKQLVKLLNNLI